MSTAPNISGIKFKHAPPDGTRATLGAALRHVRGITTTLAAPLSAEDQAIQSMPDASPTKWHLGHTTWFFETFLLKPFLPGYTSFHPKFDYLFNSYYLTVGQMHPRPQRGLLSRPSLDEVHAYRAHVETNLDRLIATCDEAQWPEVARRIEIGLHHEQQHQELILTDIKHVLSCNPLEPAAFAAPPAVAGKLRPLGWISHDEGVHEIGAFADDGFCFDNETPRHQVILQPFALADRPLANAEVLAFIEDGGYQRPELWLSDGWACVEARGWTAPLYWRHDGSEWREFTLAGPVPLDPARPATHLSYFEADAIARWTGYRLPTELELERALTACSPEHGHVLRVTPDETMAHAPEPPALGDEPQDGHPARLYGTVWEWTQSPYAAYPRFRTLEGSLGEYNGKFMCNQFVLRGGSSFTPEGHIRATYRNFFPPDARWQLSGLRLAKDL
jgi:ergothioneine biosynthesis protein EgtB